MSGVAAAAGFDRLLSDERLTRRAVGGDERAFATIFRRYHQSLYRYCLTILGNPEDAQDALQNTMMKVMRALPGEERKIELKPWLYRIAHNESIDLLRRRRETRELDVEQIVPGYGLAEDVATRERLRRLLVDLQELPERQREVLVMRELVGLDFAEIGTALATTDAVARQTLYEARQSLRQMEEGREMSCEVVTRALSDGDGRVTRRRDVRAHLRSCADCRRFREEIDSRERTLAALSPLPAVAAAGMLQGLLGGSQAATGGGLAAMLGGGAAKTVGASAAAKGVATAAVVAAVGVTAADRSGVIHLGLPGEGGGAAKSSTAVPGPAGDIVETSVGGDRGGLAGATAKDGQKQGRRAEQAMQAPGGGSASEVTSAAEKGSSASVPTASPGLGTHPGSPQADSRAQGQPPLEQVAGKGHEEHPAAATQGQEAAAEHVPPVSVPAPGKSGTAPGKSGEATGEKADKAEKTDKSSGSDGVPATGTPKSAPTSPPSSPGKGKGPPEGAPAPKPESPKSQPHPTGPPPKAEAAPSPAPANPGKGAEKSAEAGKKG
jgi:RNA polymerase sigma factor (sigma-70 family)